MSSETSRPADEARIVLAALYAAGALTTAERADVDARVAAGDALLGAEISSHDRTIERLVEDTEPVTPRAETRAALLAQIAQELPDDPRVAELASLVSSLDVDASWEPVVIEGRGWSGVEARQLHVDIRRRKLTALLRMAPGALIPAHVHDQDEECFVVEGELSFAGQRYVAGDYFRLPAGSTHDEQTSSEGCICLVITSLTNTYL